MQAKEIIKRLTSNKVAGEKDWISTAEVSDCCPYFHKGIIRKWEGDIVAEHPFKWDWVDWEDRTGLDYWELRINDKNIIVNDNGIQSMLKEFYFSKIFLLNIFIFE